MKDEVIILQESRIQFGKCSDHLLETTQELQLKNDKTEKIKGVIASRGWNFSVYFIDVYWGLVAHAISILCCQDRSACDFWSVFGEALFPNSTIWSLKKYFPPGSCKILGPFIPSDYICHPYLVVSLVFWLWRSADMLGWYLENDSPSLHTLVLKLCPEVTVLPYHVLCSPVIT